MLLTEYLAFVGSIGWLVAAMMAAILPSLPGGFGRRHAGWLFAFCLTRLFVEVATFAMFGAEPPGETWSAIAAIASGMVLWEFARRLWNGAARRRIHGATHLVAAECIALLLAVGLSLGDGLRPAWFTPVGFAASLLPGVLGFGSALLLWRCLGHDAALARRTALRAAVLGLGAYGLFTGMPGLSAGELLPPWIVVGGLGFAAIALPAARTRFTIACATGLLLACVVGPYATSLYVDFIARAQLDRLRLRGEAATAPLQGRFAAMLAAAPADTSRLTSSEFEKIRGADPLLRAVMEWKPHANEPSTRAGLARGRSFVTPADPAAGGRGVVTLYVPVRAASYEPVAAWLALEYPDAFWAAERRHAQRTGLALCGALAAFCAIGFVLAVRHALENAQQLAIERAQSADRAKTEFLAFLSHEMRTPLQTILGRAELLDMSPNATEGTRHHAAAIETQGRLLLRLVNDLLDLGTLEAGKFQLHARPFSLRAALAAVDDTVRTPAAAKQLAFEVVVERDVPDALIGDEARLRQILGNLLGNAVKYTPHGKVSLEVNAATTDATSAPLVFCVSDTGPGLPPEKIERLFTLFTRLDSGDTFTREGTGVGLALVRRLCELMGGTAAAANRAGGGAEFTVHLTFPLDAGRTEVMDHAADSVPASGSGLRVLVAEDNAPAREFLVEALQALGHRAEAVGDGPAALAAASTGRYDAALLDVNLPGRDGVSIARVLAAQHPTLRLIGCSAEVFAHTREAALAAGMAAFLQKPVTIAALSIALQPAAPASLAETANLFERLRVPELMAHARIVLARELPAKIERLRSAQTAGDAAALQRQAHLLHSTALMAGDAILAELCRRLERAAAAGGTDGIPAILDELAARASVTAE